MATKYIMYSESPDGSNMVSTPTAKTIYTGIAYMPDSISTNPNMIDNSDFRNGMRYWSTENVVPTIINNQAMRMVAYAADPEINNLRRAYYSGTNPFSSIAIGENLYSCIEARHETGGKGSLWVGQVDNRVLTPLTTTNQIYQFTMNKVSTNTVSISVDFDDVVQWTKIAVCKSPISSWKPSPADWLADPANYTWVPIDNRAVRYSPNPNGSGLTIDRKWDSRYRGAGSIPLDLYSRENLYIGTKDFSGDKWINLSIYTNSSSYNGFVVKQRSLTYNGLCQNISVKEGETYTICGYLKTDVGAKFNCEYHCGTQNSESATAQTISTYKNGIVQSSRLGNDSNNEFSWMSYTFKIVKSGIIRPGFENTTTLPFYVCGLYLVKEGYSPDLIWKQAPEDWANTPLNLTWSALPDVLQPEQNGNIEGMFPLTNLKISNGIYYHLNVTKDTSLPYSREIPGWTYFTVLDCKFNNTLNAGNTNILLSQLEGLVIKRRKKGTFNWITLKEIKVNSPADLNIVYQDSFLPSGSEFQYALVPILNGNIEGEYVMNEVFSSFNGVFISDNETIFKLYNAVIYGGTTANTTKGMIQPIGRRYPIMVNNSEVNYKAGQISAQLLGYKFEKTRNIDRFDIVGQTDDLTDYLNTNTAKVITDWNGNIYVSRVSSSPTIAYNSAYGNGITTVSFDWVEQGKYDNQEDMYENGLVDTRG